MSSHYARRRERRHTKRLIAAASRSAKSALEALSGRLTSITPEIHRRARTLGSTPAFLLVDEFVKHALAVKQTLGDDLSSEATHAIDDLVSEARRLATHEVAAALDTHLAAASASLLTEHGCQLRWR